MRIDLKLLEPRNYQTSNKCELALYWFPTFFLFCCNSITIYPRIKIIIVLEFKNIILSLNTPLDIICLYNNFFLPPFGTPCLIRNNHLLDLTHILATKFYNADQITGSKVMLEQIYLQSQITKVASEMFMHLWELAPLWNTRFPRFITFIVQY